MVENLGFSDVKRQLFLRILKQNHDVDGKPTHISQEKCCQNTKSEFKIGRDHR